MKGTALFLVFLVPLKDLPTSLTTNFSVFHICSHQQTRSTGFQRGDGDVHTSTASRCLVASLEETAALYCPETLGQAEWRAMFQVGYPRPRGVGLKSHSTHLCDIHTYLVTPLVFVWHRASRSVHTCCRHPYLLCALFQDARVLLSLACSELEGRVGEVAGALRTAAGSVLSGSTTAAAGAVPSGTMALQLLRRLGSKGLLDRHPAAEALLASCRSALGLPGSTTAVTTAQTSGPSEEEAEGSSGPSALSSAFRLSRALLSLFVVSGGTASSSGCTAGVIQPPSLVAELSGQVTECSETVLRAVLAVGAIHTLLSPWSRGRALAAEWQRDGGPFLDEMAAACRALQAAPGLRSESLGLAVLASDAALQVGEVHARAGWGGVCRMG